MPDVTIRYNRQVVTLRVPDGSIMEPVTRPAPATTQIKPFDTAGLRDAIAGARHLLVVVNDGFRPTPTQAMLDNMKPLLQEVQEVHLIVATGKHPGPNAAEIEMLLGPAAREYETYVHDAKAPCTAYDKLTDGSPLELNNQVEWSDTILLLGSVEPHFFAGYTGGAKQILPGLASEVSIEANHRHAVHPACRPCNTGGNPVAAPIREVAARFGEKLWSVQGVMGPNGWEFFFGREAMVYASSTRRCRETAGTVWPEPVDLMIVVVDEPLDRNLYQLQKGFENHQWAVRDGGDVLLVSSCRDGVGNEFFAELMGQYPDWQHLPPWEEQTYSLGLHKLYRTASAKQRIGLYLHSTLPPEQVRKFWFEPVDDIQAWVSAHARDRKVGVVYDAAATFSEVAN